MSFVQQFKRYELDPKTQDLLELQTEMIEKASEIFALYYDSIAAFDRLSKSLPEWKRQIAEDVQNQFGVRIDENTWKQISPLRSKPPHAQSPPGDEFARSLVDYRMRLGPAGRNVELMGKYLVIALYQFWEDSWRGRIAGALGLADNNKVLSDFWGDLRLIRICLLHKHGVANHDVEKKCTVFHWFRDGDPILIDREKVEAIVSAFRTFVLSDFHSLGNAPKSA